jgi:hypothetical protein
MLTKLPIIRVASMNPADIRDALIRRGIVDYSYNFDMSGVKLTLSIKKGKRRILRSVRPSLFKFVTRCTCCGPYLAFEL